MTFLFPLSNTVMKYSEPGRAVLPVMAQHANYNEAYIPHWAPGAPVKSSVVSSPCGERLRGRARDANRNNGRGKGDPMVFCPKIEVFPDAERQPDKNRICAE